MTREDKLTECLRAIADPTRRHILRLLKLKNCCSLGKPTGLCACDIEARMQLTQPTISHHMKVLQRTGLIEAHKLGQWMWYQRNERALDELARLIEEEC